MSKLRDFFVNRIGAAPVADEDQPAGAPPATLLGILVEPDQFTLFSEAQFHATGRFTDGTTKDLSKSVTWSSSDSNIVSIDADGIATAGTVGGKATITAKHEESGNVGFADVTVPPPATLLGILVEPDQFTLFAEAQFGLRATARFTDGSTKDFTKLVTWSSSAPDIVSIDANGIATAGTVGGNATITASHKESGQVGFADVTVPNPG